MYFDSHAHLDEACFAEDFEEILARMAQNQVRGMMNIGCDLPSSERSIRLAERYDWIWAAVGSHPDDADQVDEARILMYRKLARHSRVKAIGEIGLDYHYEDIPRDVQQHAFRLQIALAEELEDYIATEEPFEVAGALTIDGLGGAFVSGIEGDHHNVIGLSLPLLRTLLADMGIRWTSLWNRAPV